MANMVKDNWALTEESIGITRRAETTDTDMVFMME